MTETADDHAERRVAAGTVRDQVLAVFAAWGVAAPVAAASADIMTETDLYGIDSHGIAMVPLYERYRADDFFNPGAEWRTVRDAPVTALLDGDGGLGHLVSLEATQLAIAKAGEHGLAAVAVRNSCHFGAAGMYARRIAEAGLIGLVTSNVHRAAIVPTRARSEAFGTNPIAFAAPSAGGRPFLLDMATSTVAYGKVRLADYAGRPVPEGWALDADGRPTTDAAAAVASHKLTPLGATDTLSSHKGYGLAAMVEILSAMLPGAVWPGRRTAATRHADIGHFFLAIDPKAFREEGAFEDDVGALVAGLRALAPVDPALPVLVHGDKEYAAFDARSRDGIPLPATLVEDIRGVCVRAGITSLL